MFPFQKPYGLYCLFSADSTSWTGHDLKVWFQARVVSIKVPSTFKVSSTWAGHHSNHARNCSDILIHATHKQTGLRTGAPPPLSRSTACSGRWSCPMFNNQPLLLTERWCSYLKTPGVRCQARTSRSSSGDTFWPISVQQPVYVTQRYQISSLGTSTEARLKKQQVPGTIFGWSTHKKRRAKSRWVELVTVGGKGPYV